MEDTKLCWIIDVLVEKLFFFSVRFYFLNETWREIIT